MNQPVFIDSWLKLDKKAQKRFTLFIESPYFNTNPHLIECIKHMNAAFRKKTPSVSKEALFQKLFPNQDYEDSKIRYILSDLTSLLKKFISIELDQRNATEHKLQLVKLVSELNMEKLHKKEWNLLGKQINNAAHLHESNPLIKYKYYLEAQEQLNTKSRKAYAHLLDASYQLNVFFISERLKLACLNIGHQSGAVPHEEQTLLNAILHEVKVGKYDHSPNVMIYYYAYEMLINNNDGYYFKLSDWLVDNTNLLPTKEVEDIYLLGINFCIARINAGNRDYMKHAFDLYKSGLESKVFLKDGYLSIHNYKNILRLGLTQKAYEWTESFLHEFKEWLPKEEAENTFTYNLAYFHFQKKDYEQAMDLLREVKFKDVYNNLDSRRILLRIYYELEEWSALDSHLDSFQSYVMRQKNIGYHKVANLNLVKITRLMMKKFPLSDKSKDQIKKRIKNAEHLAEKDWVIKSAGLS